jgi:hypothetical protein
VDRRVIDRHAVFLHECFDLARTQGISYLPADARQNDIRWEVGALEGHSRCDSPSVHLLDYRGRLYPK